MKSLQIGLLEFLNKVSRKTMAFEDQSFNFKPMGAKASEEIKDLDSEISFERCKLVVEDFKELRNLFLYNSDNFKVSISNCQIFIRFFDFRDACAVCNSGFFEIFKNNELIIYNAIYEYDKDSLEDFDNISNTFRENNCKVILTIKTIFKYYPEDFDRYVEVLKNFKIQNIHFDFLYTSNKVDSIPSLVCFSSILGQLRIRNANLNRKELPFCYNIYLESCKGAVATVCRNITVRKSRDFDLRILPGTKIFVEEGSFGKIYCKGKFSLFFDNPTEYNEDSVQIMEGALRSTNKKSLLKERYNIYKFKLFVNEDFSGDNKITKFYKCRFSNCYFNSNQYLLDCEFNKCFFSEGKEFVINT